VKVDKRIVKLAALVNLIVIFLSIHFENTFFLVVNCVLLLINACGILYGEEE